MGLNIIAYRITGTAEGCLGETFLDFEPYDNFDGLRYSGDNDFASNENIEWDWVRPDIEKRYYRPKDINKAIKWVKNTEKIPIGNKSRLLNLLYEMLKDETLCVVFSR
jgi:hypothetical protein